ncbi:hypothetical protein ABEB36_005472 [Hypothenemus hampei]|uniref:Uncharacterized protein n=1 Tax=Hypothenemus hampei TaxID=57062 RepID=A0ABD1EYC0_HYPHA
MRLLVTCLTLFLTIFEDSLSATNETASKYDTDDLHGAGAFFARNLSANISVSDDGKDLTMSLNKTVEKPVVESTETSVVKFNSREELNATKTDEKKFKPSPQLENYYKFNRFQVRPAYPEPKTVPNYQDITASSDDKRNSYARGEVLSTEEENQLPFKPTGFVTFKQPTISNLKENNDLTTDRIKFSSVNAPYPYVTNHIPINCCQGSVNTGYPVKKSSVNYPNREYDNQNLAGAPSIAAPSSGRDFDFTKLVESPRSPYYSNQKTYETHYNLMEKPSYEVYHHNPFQDMSPWKKILKLLATFIPIGLLISALTPTVITVTNVNDSNTNPVTMQMSRYRSNNDSKRELQNHILTSLNYFDKLQEEGCEFRVFCELLVVARQMPDSEKHVQNLLDNFADREVDYKNKAEELKEVFQAVQNENCEYIQCTGIQRNPT